MASVRSSTRSLVPNRYGLCSRLSRRYQDLKRSLTAYRASLPEFNVKNLVERYYAPFLIRRPVRVSAKIL